MKDEGEKNWNEEKEGLCIYQVKLIMLKVFSSLYYFGSAMIIIIYPAGKQN